MVTTLTTKGQVVIPAKMRRRLRLTEGMKLAVSEENGRIILQPLSADPIEEGFGMFAGGPSLVEALLKMREEELAHEEKKGRAR